MAPYSPENPDPVIAIDLGTSECRAAIWNGSEVEILATCVSFSRQFNPPLLINGNEVVPDELYKSLRVKRLIGRPDTDPDVVEASKTPPIRVRTLGTGDCPLIGSFDHKRNVNYSTPEELYKVFLSAVIAEAERKLGGSVRAREVVLTYPLAFNRFQLSRFVLVCNMAGLSVLRLLPEPIAVTRFYAVAGGLLQAAGEGTVVKRALIFNMGAGYCDVAITTTSATADTFDLRGAPCCSVVTKATAVAGRAIGGEDLLQNMMLYLVSDYHEVFSVRWPSEREAVASLREATRALIHKLSVERRAEIDVDLGDGIVLRETVERVEFEDANATIFDNCKDLIDECLRNANVNPNDLDDVIVVGGCSRIPKIRKIVENTCKKKLYEGMDDHVLEAAVRGLATERATYAHPCGSNWHLSTFGSITMSVGVRADGDTFVPVLPKNTQIPCTKKVTFTTTIDDQTEALIVVYEGEGGTIEENQMLGYLLLEGIPKAPKGVPKIEVSMYAHPLRFTLRVGAGVSAVRSSRSEVFTDMPDSAGYRRDMVDARRGLATLKCR